MLMGRSWGPPITILHWTLMSMRFTFWMGELRSWQLMSLLRQFMPICLASCYHGDHKDPSMAVAWDYQITIIDGKKIIKCSSQGWELCCEWKDGSTSWQSCWT
eukprot:CCRYP_006155-RA/>CCRYP_006155-RA protein AED:0.55 eAED:0.72 QI:0/0/0/1/0/0/2/0/102